MFCGQMSANSLKVNIVLLTTNKNKHGYFNTNQFHIKYRFSLNSFKTCDDYSVNIYKICQQK